MRQTASRFGREHLRVLGQRIRALRETRKWSLRRLSANSNVSIAAIQKVEAGAANPSLLTVIAIIEALGEPFDQVILASRKLDGEVSVVRGELPVRPTGDVDMSDLLVDQRMRCTLKTLAARQKGNIGDLSGDAPMFGYILDGEIKLSYDDGHVDSLAVGDSFHAVAGNAAEWINPLSRKSVMLCIADRAEKQSQEQERGG